VTVPNISDKARYASIYTADNFLASLRGSGWDPGTVPSNVVFTYGGFDLLCAAQPDQYEMNPMLGPGPGRFFAVTASGGTVGICCMGIGAPAVAAQMEVLIALGVQRFLSIGTAGGLGPAGSVADVVLLTGAVRDDGVSYHYLPADLTATPDAALTARFGDALSAARIPHTDGSTWTTDAPFRETAEEIAAYRSRGVVAVEMEAAAVFAVAQTRAVPIASAVVFDTVFDDPIGAPVLDTAAAFGRLYDVFLVALDVLAA